MTTKTEDVGGIVIGASPVQDLHANPIKVSYPFPCVKCRKKESVQEDGVDAGKMFSCGVMVENMEAGVKSFYCPWFEAEPVMTHIEDKVKCESESSTCLCQPNNCGGKGACGKIISPIIDAEYEQRKALKARYEAKSRIRPIIIAPEQNKTPGRKLCDGCSYQHYDEEGVGFCGSQEDECPRGGGRF